jgi:hypothetical protein
MKLDAARLCLDCEEVHEEQVCPICSSEAFAYLTRWVQTASEPRLDRRPAVNTAAAATAVHQTRTPEQIEAYRQLIEGKPPQSRKSLVTKGVLGLAVFSLAGWAWKATRQRAARDDEPPQTG